MSILEEFRRDEQRVLDRLVDGELGQFERHQLLAALDDEPSAWRRCALAFLESQNFRWQLSRLKADATLTNSRGTGNVETLPLARRGSFWGMCLAVAASLMLAFGLGTRFTASPSAAPSTIATVTPAAATPAAATDSQAASFSPDLDESLAGDELNDPEIVTLALDGEDAGKIELPVAVASSNDAQWLDELESDAPSGLFEKLKAAGLEVVRRQRLFPVDLSDGRRLVVPVEQVNIRWPDLMEDL